MVCVGNQTHLWTVIFASIHEIMAQCPGPVGLRYVLVLIWYDLRSVKASKDLAITGTSTDLMTINT